MSRNPLNIGVCGVGTVGLATIGILRYQCEALLARSGQSSTKAQLGHEWSPQRAYSGQSATKAQYWDMSGALKGPTLDNPPRRKRNWDMSGALKGPSTLDNPPPATGMGATRRGPRRERDGEALGTDVRAVGESRVVLFNLRLEL